MGSFLANPAPFALWHLLGLAGPGLPADERPSLAALIALGAGALALAGLVVIRRNRPR